MSKLLERLQDASRSGVYRAGGDAAILDALRGSTVETVHVSLEGARGKDELLGRIAAGLNFPEWFGANWDALEDCLDDLSWRPAAGHVLLFSGALPGRDETGTLLDVLSSCAQYWAERGKPFFAVFLDPAGALALPALYREA